MLERVSKQSEFYQTHLDQVSRSFAFCIRQLKEPLRNRVGLAYLVCRILDTVEDSTWATAEIKLAQMDLLRKFISRRASEPEVDQWIAAFPLDIPSHEIRLINDSYRIFEDLHDLPMTERVTLQETALSMSRGMSYFLSQTASKNTLVLKNLVEVNRYCFFVAGIVGEMLTKLASAQNPTIELNEANLVRSHQFGLFLQKINLLKDQLDDQKVGRNLVPSHDELWDSLKQDLVGAFEYLLAIPVTEREYRLFCAWSLFLGLASAPWIKKSWLQQKFEKISRIAGSEILLRVTSAIDDNEELKKLFEKMQPTFTEKSFAHRAPSASESMAFSAFPSLYHGRLSPRHLQLLGMEASSSNLI